MKILAVDDDQIVLELLVQFMDAIGGHDLTVAQSGQEALEIIARQDRDLFDCFLFDIQMPQMDGIELLKEVRALKHHVATPVLMLTAMSEKRYIDSAFATGATDYVTKPFELTELKTRLGLLQTVGSSRRHRTSKISAANVLPQEDQQINDEPRASLFEPISIHDLDNVIDHVALENYVCQLSRSSLFGSMVFAFSIRRIERFYETLSRFEFCNLVGDVAEVIADTMRGHQFLMSYAGNGVFVCVTESGWRPDMEKLKDKVNLAFAQTEIYNNRNERLQPRVVTGKAIRLVWKTSSSLLEALAEAHTSAEENSIIQERGRGNFWLVEHRT